MDLLKLAEEVAPKLRQTPAEVPIRVGDERKTVAAAVLQDEEAAGTAVHRALELLLGSQTRNWEPESIWLGLRDHKIEIPQTNRDKILALNTLLITHAFYWEVNAFEDTCLALNNLIVIPDALQEASPAQLAWGIYEVELFMQGQGNNEEFDYEPQKYTAVSMHREGLVLAPPLLVFAQDELDRLIRGHQDIIPDVKARWEKLNKAELDGVELAENPTDVQLAKLIAIQLYIDERSARYKADLDRLV